MFWSSLQLFLCEYNTRPFENTMQYIRLITTISDDIRCSSPSSCPHILATTCSFFIANPPTRLYLLAHSCYSEHKMWHQKQHNIKVGPFIFFSPIFFFSSSFYSYIIPPCGLISLKSTQTWFQFSIGKWLDAKKLQWKGAVFTL